MKSSKSSRSKRTAVVAALLLTIGIVGVAIAASVQVDSFDSGAQTIEVDALNQISAHIVDATGSALGNERDILLEYVTGTGSSVFVDAGDNNRLDFNQNTSSTNRATITWDGVDPSGTALQKAQTNAFLLGSVDLISSGPANDAFHVEIPFNDNKADVRLRVFTTDGTNYYEYTIHLPGGIGDGQHVDFVIPFTSFTAVGTPSWTDVDAIEVQIIGTIQAAADLAIDFLDADNFREFGDLPTTGDTTTGPADYSVNVLNAYHTPLNGLRLGNNTDAEVTHNASLGANGDDTDQAPPDDEDGVTIDTDLVPNWTQGGTAALSVVINPAGSLTTPQSGILPLCGTSAQSALCRLNGWIDWNNDGDFDDASEKIANIDYTSGGAKTVLFNVPVDPTNASFYARFRLCGGVGFPTDTCDTPTGNAGVGEVEDYYWEFGPTAVTLNALSARSAGSETALIIFFATALTIGAAGTVLVIRRRK